MPDGAERGRACAAEAVYPAHTPEAAYPAYTPDHVGPGAFYLADKSRLSSLREGHQGLEGRKIAVEVSTLDACLATGVHDLSFVKVDVEGGEVDFLWGARETVHRFGPLIAMEVSSEEVVRKTSTSEAEFFLMVHTMRKAGYGVFSFLGERLLAADVAQWNVILAPLSYTKLDDLLSTARDAIDVLPAHPHWSLYDKSRGA